MYPRSRLNIKKYRTSSISPAEICNERRSSRVVRLPNPCAMFAGTEADARRNCETMPNRSDRGNPPVNLYTASASSCDLCHTVNSVKLLIFTSHESQVTSYDFADAAPLTISISSFVMLAWRILFMSSVSESIRSEAFRVAESMAVIRAACSAAADSKRMR